MIPGERAETGEVGCLLYFHMDRVYVMMKASFALPALLLAATLLSSGCTEDNPHKAADRKDTGYLMLDGGGPMGKVDMPGPKPDSGGSSGQKTKGKFCHNVTSQGKTISLTWRMGSVSMITSSNSCSRCTDISIGSQTVRLYSGSQYLGAASTVVKAGFEYVYLVKLEPGSNHRQLSKEELDVKKGDSCEKFNPKF